MGGDTQQLGRQLRVWRKLTAAYTAGFMASVTCRQTAEDRDQIQNSTIVSSMQLSTFTFKNT